jgi:hypothetical protein
VTQTLEGGIHETGISQIVKADATGMRVEQRLGVGFMVIVIVMIVVVVILAAIDID